MRNPQTIEVREVTSGAAKVQQWHKGPRPETAAASAKQGKYQRDPETEVVKLAAGSSVGIPEMSVNTIGEQSP
jgi:hypothetical protein